MLQQLSSFHLLGGSKREVHSCRWRTGGSQTATTKHLTFDLQYRIAEYPQSGRQKTLIPEWPNVPPTNLVAQPDSLAWVARDNRHKPILEPVDREPTGRRIANSSPVFAILNGYVDPKKPGFIGQFSGPAEGDFALPINDPEIGT